jgi:hypothetical protein
MGFGGEMYDRIEALIRQQHFHSAGIADVAVHEAKSRMIPYRLQAREVACVRQCIQHNQPGLRMSAQPMMNEIAADKAGASSD